MSFVLAFALMLSLAILCVAPGFFFVRKLRWSSIEILCASIALSIVLIYLAAEAIYLLNVNWKWCWLASGVFTLMGAAAAKDLFQLLRRKIVRQCLSAFGILFLLGFLLLSLMRTVDAGGGDWLEHFQRTLFFLDHLPNDTVLTGPYVMPARPPLMNLVAAYFLGQFGERYDLFQIVFLFLNLLIYFPCVAIAGLLVKNGTRRTWLIAAFLATSPIVLQNATYTWTKELCDFYVILSFALYARGWRLQSPSRIVAAAASMAAGILVHYSAGPFAVVMALHYLLSIRSRREKRIELVGCSAAASALLCTWFVWSIFSFGWHATVSSNTTISDSAKFSSTDNLMKIATNVRSTLLPHPLFVTAAQFHWAYYQPNPYGYVHDYAYMMYQHSLSLSLGSIGWLAVIYLLVRALLRMPAQWTALWCIAIPLTIVGCIATHGTAPLFGVADIVLQPVTLIGLTFLAAGLGTLPPWLRYALVVGVVIDAALGIILLFRMEMHFIGMLMLDGSQVVPISSGLRGIQSVINCRLRLLFPLRHWADHLITIRWIILIAAILLLCRMLIIIASAAAGQSRGARVFAVFVAVVFLALAGACVSDDWMGYRLADVSSAAQQAMQDLQPQLRAIAEHPDSVQAHYQLGATLYELGQFDAAENSLVEATLLDPQDFQATYVLRLLNSITGQPLTQKDLAFAQNLQVDPASVSDQLNLALALDRRGHHLPARQRLLQIAAQHANSIEIESRVVQALANLGFGDNAISQCTEAVKIHPNSYLLQQELRDLRAGRELP